MGLDDAINFFQVAVLEKNSSKFFPKWLPHHYDVMIILTKFSMSSHSYGKKNIVIISSAVAENEFERE